MAMHDTTSAASGVRLAQSHGLVLGAFVLTLFTSALLLFGLQPLFAKIVLPKLGGSPMVWSVALVFFQGVLLLGYAYAHVIVTYLSRKVGLFVHLGVLAVAALWLPIAYPAGWLEVPQSGVPLWLMGLFFAGVGFPFFAVSANAPLLQAWFASTGNPHSRDPYFLYGASNVGSFAALLCYPFLLEPLLPLGSQTAIWTFGYGLLCVLIACCGGILWALGRLNEAPAKAEEKIEHAASKPKWIERASWVGLAMVPSGLLVGVTAYITTDLVAAPFLWVVPLALFLATFVITFARKPVISHDMSLKLHALLIAPLYVMLFLHTGGIGILPLHLAVFFICAMVCHGELVKRRPDAAHLTEFFLWMSFGGVLGGVFASLIAPQIFTRVFEYPILLLAVFFCRSDFWAAVHKREWRQFWSFGLLAFMLVISMIEPVHAMLAGLIITLIACAIIVSVALTRNQTITQTGLVGAGMVFLLFFGNAHKPVDQVRSFFGVHSITSFQDSKYHLLMHGTTLHGAEQRKDDDGKPLTTRPEPLTYYHSGSPLAAAVRTMRERNGGALGQVALIGLGTGAMACHRNPGENWRFFEIDPEVVKIARDPSKFRYLAACGESEGIVLGDGRITLNREADQKFDVIVLDAFSSDSIPVHLMTKEAMDLYFQKLKPGGSLIFHISNRYMELASVVAATAAENGAVTYVSKKDDELWPSDLKSLKLSALVAVVGRKSEDLGNVAKSNRWLHIGQDRFSTPWTDDYSNILGALYRAQVSGVAPKVNTN